MILIGLGFRIGWREGSEEVNTDEGSCDLQGSGNVCYNAMGTYAESEVDEAGERHVSELLIEYRRSDDS